MLPRFPTTFWKLVNRELWRLVVVTTAVVVVVACFAVAVKPFADGALGPVDILRFMGYAAVPMLLYVLPFAAGFAATLAYHRLAADNELTAAYAGGISHRTVLLPAFLGGAVLSIALFVLADQAMPRLLLRMNEIVAQDVARIMAASIEAGDPVSTETLSVGGLGGSPSSQTSWVIFADRMIQADDPGEGDISDPKFPYRSFVLSGVLAVEQDKAGHVISEISSHLADVWLYHGSSRRDDNGDTPDALVTTDAGSVQIHLRDAVVGLRNGVKNRTLSDVGDMTITVPVPDVTLENPKYLSWSQLNLVEANPERYNWLLNERRGLAIAIADKAATDDLRAAFARDHRALLTDSAGRTVAVRAAALADTPDSSGYALAPDPALRGIEITTILEDGRARTSRARRAWLSVKHGTDTSGRLTIELEEVTTTGPAVAGDPAISQGADTPDADTPGGAIKGYFLTGLDPAPNPLPQLLALSIPDLLARGEQFAAAHPEDRTVYRAGRALRNAQRELHDEILSKKHERVASSLACLVMVLTGAVMAMRLRDSLPLTVYLWSFLPALLAVITINGGQKVTHQNGAWGLLLEYGGVMALAVLFSVEYARVAKH